MLQKLYQIEFHVINAQTGKKYKKSRKHKCAILVGALVSYLVGHTMRPGHGCTCVPWHFFSRHGPIQSEIWPNMGRNNYIYKNLISTYLLLVIVSHFWYFILIYEHHVIFMYSLYYLLLLLNWYMFTIIWRKKMLSNI